MRSKPSVALVAMGLLAWTGIAPTQARSVYRTERIFHLPLAPGESSAQAWAKPQPDELDEAALRRSGATISSRLPVHSFAEIEDRICTFTLFSLSPAPQ
ncbi:hypothetical protein [Bosea sp. (in: a-proteobacteria)]|uniref:hypothetical protein n=1 Tax=Bosea sp. (in: a-proteobacteria) TaxID=1871050 RepID=UPI0031FECD79|nr:hypothetical protein [Bosea sp. (in: a-proteobacteria)]